MEIEQILAKAMTGGDISPAEGVALLQQRDPVTLEAIRHTADTLRQRQVGETVTYVVNRNINFTNICEQHCSFCAFRRDAQEEGAYWLDFTPMLEKTTEAIAVGATEICMQGGLNPEAKIDGLSLNYYLKLVDTIKGSFPALHLHAFSPQEVQFIARQDEMSYRDVLLALKDAGVGSLPGTAAEVLDDEVRRVLCPEKIDSATWLEIIGLAHEIGLPTTSTMLSGHIETSIQQITHLEKLRQRQRQSLEAGYSAAMTEFIVLPFVGQEAPKPLRRRVGRDQPVLADALLLMAVARIYLGNWIVNHQPSWVKLGLGGATEALTWGCNDIGGTLMEEHITTMAGAQGGTCMTVKDLRGAIAACNRPARQRDTLYGLVESSNGAVSPSIAVGSAGNTAPARQSRSQSLTA
ncbi:7,8-didemethyl-8-hydroxy-5-deazariboflavin synthase subunit CofH [Leptolyngbya sp. CCNP1308]|uniref:7,8-didemethyl-8-hydroxy-5-deazariboflavin synthase subunit CofH n=1 Tax=Leptolyngbya sp. CCNP1308 TaxID=3110255 RepID=UPI002B1F2A96|nr:7,8-didemethyl-8-hydroxy-5-deazariboflavin synthase subunit CofH [Leptolyngbya sp. CCNP1308]MEA5450709.1 7,8-didemethyl-8-hydroxy-5-deazariboflavin synthase subunit CofH [Leptolyngbya sp. CCNP1308]